MRVFPALALVVSALSCTAQTAAPVPAQAAPGFSTYTSDTLHFRYTYPANFLDASSVVGPAFEASIGQEPGTEGKNGARCVTLPFSAMQSGGQQVAIVMIARADAGCLKHPLTAADLPKMAQEEVQGLSATGARPQFETPVAFTVAEHPAERVTGKFSLPTGQQLHAETVCVLVKPDVACWQFLASSEAALRTMRAFPVSFGTGAPQPLVPETATAAKP